MTSTQLPVSENEQAFRKNAIATEGLHNALQNPYIVQALAILRDAVRPRGYLPEPTPGLHPDTNIAHYYHFQQGCNLVLDRLQRMSRPFNPNEIVEDEEENEYAHAGQHLQPLPIPSKK